MRLLVRVGIFFRLFVKRPLPCTSVALSPSPSVCLIVQAHLVNREICRWLSLAARRSGRREGTDKEMLKPTHIHLSEAATESTAGGLLVLHYPRRLFITRAASANSAIIGRPGHSLTSWGLVVVSYFPAHRDTMISNIKRIFLLFFYSLTNHSALQRDRVADPIAKQYVKNNS